MENVCKWCGDPHAAFRHSARAGRVTSSGTMLVIAIGRRTPHLVPTVLGRSGTRPVASVMTASNGVVSPLHRCDRPGQADCSRRVLQASLGRLPATAFLGVQPPFRRPNPRGAAAPCHLFCGLPGRTHGGHSRTGDPVYHPAGGRDADVGPGSHLGLCPTAILGQVEYRSMTLLSSSGCTQVARGCTGAATSLTAGDWAPSTRRGTVVARARYPRPGRAVPGGSEAWGLRMPSQAGRLVPDGDPAHRQRPARGAVRAERGTGGCRVAADSRFLTAEEPDRVIPVAGPAGPALHSPAGIHHVWAEPGEAPAFRFDVAPHALSARAAAQPHPAVRTHCDHHPGASRQRKPGCSAYPGEAVPRSAPSSRRPDTSACFLLVLMSVSLPDPRRRPLARLAGLTRGRRSDLGCLGRAGWTVVAGLPHSFGLIHTETWAGSRAWCTTPARSSRTESRSTVSFSRAANAATVDSAS